MAANKTTYQKSRRAIYFPLLTLGFLLVATVSCLEDAIEEQSLEGKWLLYAATRDGQNTTTLKDAYFNFVDDTLLVNNLLREEMNYNYQIKGNKILQTGEMNVEYSVDYLSQDTLELSAQIREYQFRFFLMKDTLDLIQ